MKYKYREKKFWITYKDINCEYGGDKFFMRKVSEKVITLTNK